MSELFGETTRERADILLRRPIVVLTNLGAGEIALLRAAERNVLGDQQGDCHPGHDRHDERGSVEKVPQGVSASVGHCATIAKPFRSRSDLRHTRTGTNKNESATFVGMSKSRLVGMAN